MKRLAALIALLLLTVPLVALATEKVDICHAAGLDGTTHYETLNISVNALGAHFNDNGTPKAGHEDDYMGPCQTTTTSTSTTTTSTTGSTTTTTAQTTTTSPPSTEQTTTTTTIQECPVGQIHQPPFCLDPTTTTVAPPTTTVPEPPILELPFTGSETGMLVLAAAMFLLLGGAILKAR